MKPANDSMKSKARDLGKSSATSARPSQANIPQGKDGTVGRGTGKIVGNRKSSIG